MSRRLHHSLPLPTKTGVQALGALAMVLIGLSACSPAAPSTPTALPASATPLPPTQAPLPPTATITLTPTPPPTATITPIPFTATPSLSPTPSEPAPGATRVWESDQMVQVYIPAGEFLMGSEDEDAKTSLAGGRAFPENPPHTVSLDSFWIDKFEVTNAQYKACVDAGVCQPPHLARSVAHDQYYGNPEFNQYPVIWVSWFMATDYCTWAGRRLPTEAEWEKAARGTDGRKYPWGNEPVDGTRANYCDKNCPWEYADYLNDDGYGDIAPVGSYPAGASPYGVLDMAGNVWEWTSTLVDFYPYDAADGREDQSVIGERVWRGGPWGNSWWWMRVTLRYRSVDWYWRSNLGFRCASTK